MSAVLGSRFATNDLAKSGTERLLLARVESSGVLTLVLPACAQDLPVGSVVFGLRRRRPSRSVRRFIASTVVVSIVEQIVNV
jgi:hypothetical protein